jgi:histidine triad (HIT) family protein
VIEDCPFCDYKGPSAILDQTEYTYLIEPLDPVTKGHRLVVPWSHFTDFAQDSTLTALVMGDAAAYVRRLSRLWGIEDWNLITSKGALATQTVFHFHVHLVPRRPGDGLSLPWPDA